MSVIYLVDDDLQVLGALSRLLRGRGYEVRTASSAQEFLDRHDPGVPGCAILDVSMPDLDGLELQQCITTARYSRPIIFLTGKGDVPMSVRAMRAGAIDFLMKPVSADVLLDAIARAEAHDARARQVEEELATVMAKIATLSPREREVLSHVVAGKLNKQIAGDLGTVEKTIKVHRGRIVRKLGVRSVADLVRLAEKAGIVVPRR